MREGWDLVTLADQLEFECEQVDVVAGREYPIVGVLNRGQGLLLRDPVTSESTSYPRLNRVLPGRVIYRKLTAFEGTVAVAPDSLGEAFASPEFPTFKCVKGLTPSYARLMIQHPRFWGEMALIANGIGGRRGRLHPRDFLKIQIILPPPSEQRRIIDLVDAVDTVISSAQQVAHTLDCLTDESRQVVGHSNTVRLGALARMRSGPSWKAVDESATGGEGYTPVLGIANTPAGRVLDLTQQKFVRGVPESAMRLTESSLVMIRTNGNRARIGNTYRVSTEVHGFAVSAFQIAIEPVDPEDSTFLYWALGSPAIQKQISEAASGSTGLGNVAIGWLKELELQYPQTEVLRREFVERCNLLGSTADAAHRKVDSLQSLRAELLTALISGEHEIPNSYDELIG